MANTQMERCPDCGSDNKAERLDMTDEGSIFDYPCTHIWHGTPAAPETAPRCKCGHDEPSHRVVINRSGGTFDGCYACVGECSKFEVEP